jgi:hypothetical protein
MTRKALRGAGLVDEVVERVKTEGAIASPRPLSSHAIDRLRGRAPFSPGLEQWLKFDAEWLGLFDDLEHPTLRPLEVAKLLESELGGLGAMLGKEVGPMLPGECYLLPGGTDSRRFLYAGKADDAGEYPVFWVDVDDTPMLGLEAPGIDGYLAKAFGVWPAGGEYGAVPRPYRAAMKRQAVLNFGGRDSYEAGEPGGGPSPEWFDVYVSGDIHLERALDPDWKTVEALPPLPALPKLLEGTAPGPVADCLAMIGSAADHVARVERSGNEVRIDALVSDEATRHGLLGAVLTVMAALARAGGRGKVDFRACQGRAHVGAWTVRVSESGLSIAARAGKGLLPREDVIDGWISEKRKSLANL